MVTARAVRIRAPGGIDVLELGELQVRDPGAGEVLVEVQAAGLNRADVLQRRGLYPAPPDAPPDVPGLEYAGRVAAVGHGVTDLAVGDRVMGIVGGGAMATHVVVDAEQALPVPDGLSFTDGAAIPEVFLTAFDAMRQARVALGESVLIHAVGSGVGTAAVQLTTAAGAVAIGTSRTPLKLERCADYGLGKRILASEGAFADRVREHTGGRGADVVLDTVGGAYLEENVRAMAPRGRIVVIGLLGGISATLQLGVLLSRRLTVIGTVLRSRSRAEKAALARAFAATALPLFADGTLQPVVDSVMPMAEIGEAHRRMQANDNLGKIVLTW